MNERGNLKDPDRILASSNLSDGARHLLHSLIADWGIVADLGYCDLQLAVKDEAGGFICAAQARPATSPSCRPKDMVGQKFPSDLSPFLEAALSSSRPVCPANPKFKSLSAASANWEGEKAGVVLRMAYPADHTGKYEQKGIDSSWKLFAMIPQGLFPYRVPVNTRRHNAHVPDGFVTLNAASLVTEASPNAISCFKRLGFSGPLLGQSLADVVEGISGAGEIGPDALALLSGGRPLDRVLTINNISATLRSLPLWNGREYCGAVILCREITEIRRRDNELQIKDATIAEINHRIKNNLQSVSSLLALQIRNSESEEVKKALQTAKRRVQAISILHDSLSRSEDGMIDFDSALSKLLSASADITREADQKISILYEGSFGLLPPSDASPLALILSELVANAVEHGFAGEEEGRILIRAERGGAKLSVSIADDGVGFSRFPPDGGSLGMKIVGTFVKVDFQGSILWSPAPGGGTKVDLSINLHGSGEGK